MRENQPISEDIIVRRVQRRLERYFSDLEKPKTDYESDSPEASGTKIVTLSTEGKFGKPSVATAEKKLQPPPPPPAPTPPPPPPLPPVQAAVPKVTAPKPPPPPAPLPPLPTTPSPSMASQPMTPVAPANDVFGMVNPQNDAPSGFPSAFNETKDPFAPSKTTKTQLSQPNTAIPNLPSMTPPIFGKEPSPAKIAPLSEAPVSGISTDAASETKTTSFLPVFMFFLALVAALGLLLAWYWFTGGAAEPSQALPQ